MDKESKERNANQVGGKQGAIKKPPTKATCRIWLAVFIESACKRTHRLSFPARRLRIHGGVHTISL